MALSRNKRFSNMYIVPPYDYNRVSNLKNSKSFAARKKEQERLESLAKQTEEKYKNVVEKYYPSTPV